MESNNIIDAIIERIIKASEISLSDYKKGTIRGEEDFSSQLIANIKNNINHISLNEKAGWENTILNARILEKHKEEKPIGADILMIFNIDMPGKKIEKGLLIQAKRFDQLNKTTKNEDLAGQCERMLQASSSSFVFIYTTDRIDVHSAQSAFASEATLKMMQTRTFKSFLNDFLHCWIGDIRLNEKAYVSKNLASILFPNNILFTRDASFGFIRTDDAVFTNSKNSVVIEVKKGS
ncbi:MAG: hypothetical protein SFW65_05095 [Alphaproteobacteria bacterium]|nr:hypothetical protein [Alphaproteobacteria bacterium]